MKSDQTSRQIQLEANGGPMTSTRSNRRVGTIQEAKHGTMRRTVMLAAVVAAVGLLLAGLPVAGTGPSAQAQTAQDQTQWYINDAPRLYYKGTHVDRESLNGWNNNAKWGRRENGGAGRGNPNLLYAIGGDRHSYYTYANWGSVLSNQAEWRMGSRIGTQQISVYIPRTSTATTVTYQVHITGRPIQKVTVNQRDYAGYERGTWAPLHNPSTGAVRWVVNGAEVSVWVNDNEARPNWYETDSDSSRLGINAVAMRCLDNCTTTTTPPPPPRKFTIIKEGFWGDQRIVALRSFRTIDDEWVREGDRGGIVAGEDNLSHFGRSWIAEGAKVWDAGVRVSGNALVKGSVSLRGEAKVYGNAQVFGRNVQVSGKAKVYGNARVFSFGHRTQVFGNAAEVYGNAQVYSNAKVSGNAKVYGKARVYGNTATALVYGNAKVYDNAKVRNGARVSGTARICDDADVSGRARVYGNAQVSGPSTLSSGNHGDGARYGNGCPNP